MWCHRVGKCACVGMESGSMGLLLHRVGSQEIDSNCVFLPNGVVCDCIGNGSPVGNDQVQRISRRSLSDGDNCAFELHLLVVWSEETTHDVCGKTSSPPWHVERQRFGVFASDSVPSVCLDQAVPTILSAMSSVQVQTTKS